MELSWKNPDDSDFLGTLIVCRNDRYPADYNDGTVVCDLTNSPGSQDTFLHSGLQNGNLYYYAAFAYDTDGNYSGPAYVSATPTNDNPPGPPADVTNFTATAGNAQVTLSWVNPTDADFAGTMIRYRTDGIYPVDHNDGILVCDRKNTPGSSDIFVHRGLQNGTTYYYSAFSYDAAGNYSHTAHAEATPEGPAPSDSNYICYLKKGGYGGRDYNLYIYSAPTYKGEHGRFIGSDYWSADGETVAITAIDESLSY